MSKPEQKEARRLWVEALRSGKYRQNRGSLRFGSPAGTSYCCLGVACHLYEQRFTDIHPVGNGYTAASGQTSSSILLSVVAQWLGLKARNGAFLEDGREIALWHLNDNRRLPFEQIADIIESEPDGLFVTESP